MYPIQRPAQILSFNIEGAKTHEEEPIEVDFIQFCVSEENRIKKLHFLSPQEFKGLTKHGEWITIKTDEINWPKFFNKPQWEHYFHGVYIVLYGLNVFTVNVRGRAGGNSGSSPIIVNVSDGDDLPLRQSSSPRITHRPRQQPTSPQRVQSVGGSVMADRVESFMRSLPADDMPPSNPQRPRTGDRRGRSSEYEEQPSRQSRPARTPHQPHQPSNSGGGGVGASFVGYAVPPRQPSNSERPRTGDIRGRYSEYDDQASRRPSQSGRAVPPRGGGYGYPECENQAFRQSRPTNSPRRVEPRDEVRGRRYEDEGARRYRRNIDTRLEHKRIRELLPKLMISKMDQKTLNIVLRVPLDRNEEDDHDIAIQIIEAGAEVDKHPNGPILLEWASSRGWTDVVSLMMEYGADPNAKKDCYERRSPLSKALEDKHYKIAEILINAGADVNCIERDGKTPLSYSMEGFKLTGDFRAPKDDYGYGSSFLYSDDRKEKQKIVEGQMTAAHHEAQKRIVFLLLKKGANPNGKVARGLNPLSNALINRNYELAQILVKAGANPNGKVARGLSPLSQAFKDRQWGLANMLIEAGADIHFRESNGKAPLSYAIDGDDTAR